MIRTIAFLLAACAIPSTAQETLTIASKRFTESYILGEIVARIAERVGEAPIVNKPGLGNTGILFAALKAGSIDIYPEYTGTIARELLKTDAANLNEINRRLAPLALAAGVPLGFSNSYALAMRDADAGKFGIASLSDLAHHAHLKLGLSQEFLQRKDGWPALQRAYELPFAAPRGIDHGLAYEALVAGEIDVIDIYSTDAKIAKYRLRVLRDDRAVLPAYEAVLLYRADFPKRFPKTWTALQKLEGGISAERMIAMNASAELRGIGFARVAEEFMSPETAESTTSEGRSFVALLFGDDFWRLTREHLLLVLISLIGAVLIGVPLGIWAARSRRAAQPILSTVSVIQTIPSLALLAFLIPLLGSIGTLPALVALFLYSLLPIVRNTHNGLISIPSSLRESARALGLPPSARLRLIELPLASPSIAAGIKTSAVISVGTATIAAFIGAGGYGERIAAGLAVNDNAVLLAGAIPAAALALLIEGGFALFDRWLLPAGLRENQN